MYSAPWEKFTTVISPKIKDRPMASSTKIIPSTSPVKIWGRTAASEKSIMSPLASPSAAPPPPRFAREAFPYPVGSPCAAPRPPRSAREAFPYPLGSPSAAPRQSRVSLLGAGAVVFLVRGHLGHDVGQSPLPLGLAGAAPLHDPHILEGLVVAGAPPLLALEVVVGGALPERVGHRLRVGGLGEIHTPRDLHHPRVRVGAVVAGRHVELLHRRLDELLGGGNGVLELPVPVQRAMHVLVELGAALLEVGDPQQ